MKRIHVYIASRIANGPLNQEIADALALSQIQVTLPQEFCPLDLPHELFGSEVFEHCLQRMKKSDAAVVNLDSFGKDSSWECGWFAGMGRPVIGIAQGTIAFLKDFMFKGCLSGVATPNPAILRSLQQEPTLAGVEIQELNSLSDFGAFVRHIVTRKGQNHQFTERGVARTE